MLCHATCNICKFRIIIFPTYNFHSSQFPCKYITQAHINMIFTHNNILFIFPTIHTKLTKSRTHIKQGTSWSLHGLSPNYCDTKTHHKTRRHQSRDQNQTSTQSGTARNQSQKIPILSPKILGLNYTVYHGPEDNLCQYMTFRLKIFKVGKVSTSRSLTKL